MSNTFGGFFQCLPAYGGMSRSMTQATAGGTTQLTGLVSSAILIGVLASFGYLLAHLPKVSFFLVMLQPISYDCVIFQCILSAVIVVALKGVLIQITDFPEYWRKSKLDGLLWFGTFMGVILMTAKEGMYVCLALTAFVMAYRNYKIDILGVLDNESDDDNNITSSDANDGPVAVTIRETNQTLALRIIGVVSFANYERVLKKCNKMLNKMKRSENGDAVGVSTV